MQRADTIINLGQRISTAHLHRKTGALAAGMIALYINGREEPLVVEVARQVVLGRYAPSETSSQPRIDLSLYGAFDQGVSRMHVALRRTDSELTIEDLASSNGTWLNGIRLQAYRPQALHSGDVIKLSQLQIEIHFSRAARNGNAGSGGER